MTSLAVVIPARAPAPWLDAAIRSVLAQTVRVTHCVVIDDGSDTDEIARTVAAIGDERVECIIQPHGGVARARNSGAAHTSAPLLAFLDADDLWLPMKLERQLDVLTPDDDVAVTGYVVADADGRPRGTVTVTPNTLRSWLLAEGPGMAFGSTALVRRRLFDELGGFDESLSVSADLDFAARAAARRPIALIPEALVTYRTHGGQMHRHGEDVSANMRVVLRRHVADPRDRRRAAANISCRLALSRMLDGNVTGATRALVAAARERSTSVVELPVRVAMERVRRRRRAPLEPNLRTPDPCRPTS